MLKLGADKPVWVELGYGVRVLTRSPTTGRIFRMRDQMQAACKDAVSARDRLRSLGALVGDDESPSVEELLMVSFARELIEAWEGVGDADGNPAVCDLQNKAMFAEHPYFGVSWWSIVQGPFLELLSEAKKSDSARNGTMGAGANSADGAETPDIAT